MISLESSESKVITVNDECCLSGTRSNIYGDISSQMKTSLSRPIKPYRPQSPIISNIATRANRFMCRAYSVKGAISRYTDEPRQAHSQRVAVLVANSGGSTKTVAAAYLNTVLFETDTSYLQVQSKFGSEIAQLVHEQTDFFDFESKLTVNHQDSKTIMVANLITHLDTMMKYDRTLVADTIGAITILFNQLKGGSEELTYMAAQRIERAKDIAMNISLMRVETLLGPAN